jgi:putative ABC transport system permease protein
MRILLANVRFTLRLMRRSPGFYALVLVLLTAGIGATTAMFSVVESVFLKPLPYSEPEDLTAFYRFQLGHDGAYVSAANFVDWRTQGTTFEQMAAVGTAPRSLSSEGNLPVSVDVAEVTADFFPLFRLKPLVGRLLGPDDDRPGAPRVAVLSERLWKSRFAADPGAVGRTITLNGWQYAIVGVAPRGFEFASLDQSVDIWKPYFSGYSGTGLAADIGEGRGLNTLVVVGRRRHGVSLVEAQAQMTAVAENLEVAYPDANAKTGIHLRDLHDSLVGDRGRQTWILFAAVGLVFIVISANVANLVLARAHGRRAELATRAALGATSAALVLQVVTETTVLFGIGSLLGGAVASALVGDLASQLLEGTSVQSAVPVHLDVVVLLAGVGVSLLFGLAAGLVPALVTARVDPGSVLKQTSVRGGNHRSQAAVRGLLVVTQLAVAFALLVGSSLTVTAFVRLSNTAAGFDSNDLATAVVDLPLYTYESPDKVRAFFRTALRTMGDLPGVQLVSATSSLPMSNSSQGLIFTVEGRPPWPAGEAPALGINFVAANYFDTMRIPVLRGRDFTAGDTEASRPVIILSKEAADRFFPGEDPIGRRMDWGGGDDVTWREIVGIVGDVRKDGLAEATSVQGYTPFVQTPVSTTPASTRIYFVLRTKTPEAVMAALPRLVQSLDPTLAVNEVETMKTRVAGSIGQSQRMAVVLGAFALAALLLATLGLFGLVSYATTERTRELGIRLALGSPAEAVVGLVVKSGMKLVLLGLAIGLLLSVWVAREVAAIMPGATAFDPAVVAPIPLVLGIAGLVACLLPALRAVRTPPASALRYE